MSAGSRTTTDRIDGHLTPSRLLILGGAVVALIGALLVAGGYYYQPRAEAVAEHRRHVAEDLRPVEVEVRANAAALHQIEVRRAGEAEWRRSQTEKVDEIRAGVDALLQRVPAPARRRR